MSTHFSWKISIVTALLSLGMVGMAVWQWNRHIWKIGVINHLTSNLERQPVELTSLSTSTDKSDWAPYYFRRVRVSGTFDFTREVVIRNRRLGKVAGFHVITPLQLDGSNISILINRGFLPIGAESQEIRRKFQPQGHTSFTALLKEPVSPKMFSPRDGDAGIDKMWVDSWLRVDVAKMQRQIPYSVLPVYAERIGDEAPPELASKIVQGSDAGRNEILLYTTDNKVENQGLGPVDGNYPLAAHDTTPPPDIHLGYVWEWSFMALLTTSIGIILQLPRPGRIRVSQ